MEQTERVQIISENTEACLQQDCGIALLRQRVFCDRRSGRCVLQLRLQNRTEKPVRALILRLDCLDAEGESLARMPACAMTKLSADAGACFGEDRPLLLRSRLTQTVSITLLRILFADGSDWRCREGAAGFAPIRQAASDAQLRAGSELAGERRENSAQAPQQRENAPDSAAATTLEQISAPLGCLEPEEEATEDTVRSAEEEFPEIAPLRLQPEPPRKRHGFLLFLLVFLGWLALFAVLFYVAWRMEQPFALELAERVRTLLQR